MKIRRMAAAAAVVCAAASVAPAVNATPKKSPTKPVILQFKGLNGNTPNGAPNCYAGQRGVLDGSAWCYGVTYLGGKNNNGALYRIKPNGSRYKILANFAVLNGLTPSQWPVFDPSTSALYGTCSQGGNAGSGSIYKYDFSTNTLALIAGLSGPVGTTPQGSPVIFNGNLYGATGQSAGSGFGGIWTLPLAGGKPTLVHSFAGPPNDIATSFGALTYNPTDGLIYAMAFNGGQFGMGGIASFNPSAANPGSTYRLRASLNASTGSVPQMGAVIAGKDGLMYGSGWMGGANDAGTVFSFNPATNAASAVYSLNPSTTGSSPYNQPAESRSGRFLYGISWKGGKGGAGAIYAIEKATGRATVLLALDLKRTGGKTSSGVEVDPSGRYLLTTTSGGGTQGIGTLISLPIPARFR